MRRCESCNRPLRSPQSVELGFGPGCWARLEPAQRDSVLAHLSSRPRRTGDAAATVPAAGTSDAARSRAANGRAEGTSAAARSLTVNGPAASAPVAARAPGAGASAAAGSPAPVDSGAARPAADATSHQPRPPQPSSSALAVLTSWTVGLLLVLGLVLYWRWLLLGLGVLVAMGVTGLLLERLQERRRAVADSTMRKRDPARRREKNSSVTVTPPGRSRTLPTSPGGP